MRLWGILQTKRPLLPKVMLVRKKSGLYAGNIYAMKV
jgi:hypothetical protein